MDIIKNFDNIIGWIDYKLTYEDGSNNIEQFKFKDFWKFRYYLGEHFKQDLKNDYDYDDILLIAIHIQDKDNNFHIHMNEDALTACCHNEIDSKLIDENYIKQLEAIKNDINTAKNILDITSNRI